MFAIITAALISGGMAERVDFKAYIVFIFVWSTVVYDPICHWVWGGGWLGDMTGHVGHQTITDETVAGRPDTVDWSIGASYATHGFDLSLVYADTDLTTAECAAGCDGEVIIGISRSF